MDKVYEQLSWVEESVYWGWLFVIGMMAAWLLLYLIITYGVALMMGGKVRRIQAGRFVVGRRKGKWHAWRDKPRLFPEIEIDGAFYENRVKFRAYRMICSVLRLSLEIMAMYVVCSLPEYLFIVFPLKLYIGMFMLFEGILVVREFRPFGSGISQQRIYDMKQISREILMGVRPGDVSISLDQPVRMEGEPCPVEILEYVRFRYCQAVEEHDLPTIHRAMMLISKGLGNTTKYYEYGRFYAELAFYYSFFNWDDDLARLYYSICPFDIEKNMDMDIRRIYAYYLYHVEENPRRALEVIREGLDAEADYEYKGLIAMEKELLYLLKNTIYEDLAARSTTLT